MSAPAPYLCPRTERLSFTEISFRVVVPIFPSCSLVHSSKRWRLGVDFHPHTAISQRDGENLASVRAVTTPVHDGRLVYVTVEVFAKAPTRACHSDWSSNTARVRIRAKG